MSNIEEQLMSYFSGTADEQTILDVESWIAESGENEDMARNVEYICAMADVVKTAESVDSEAALQRLHGKIRAGRRRTVFRHIANIAAVMILPLLVATGFFAYEYFHLDESEYVQMKTTSGMIASVTLPDGSSVWLNSNSILKYPERFTGSTREVQLDGEGYFKVSADKERKFIVNTKAMQVEVFGTEFNVDAYDAENRDVRTMLVSGKVQVRYDDDNKNSHIVKIAPGEMLSFNPEDRVIMMSKVNCDVVTSWKDGKIVLMNTKLEDALRMIENRYHVKFEIKNAKLLDNRYTGQFKGHRLDVVLEHFRRTNDIRFVRNEAHEEGVETIEVY